MKKAYIFHLVSLLFFGSNGVIARALELPSYHIVLMRTLLGGFFLLALFLLTKGKFTFHKKLSSFFMLVLSGVAMGTSWMFLYEAFDRIGVGVATLIYYCGPVIVMILSPLIFKEELTAGKVFGFFIVLVGLFCINGKILLEDGNLWGFFCGIMSAVTYAVMVIANKKASAIKGLENSVLQLLIAFVTVSIFVGFKSGYSIAMQPSYWIPILVIGILNTGIGCYLYFSTLDTLPVQTVAICGYLEPLSAVLFSALIPPRETMVPIQILGAVLIIGGAFFGEMSGMRKQKRRIS